jgi:hypothetical protein
VNDDAPNPDFVRDSNDSACRVLKKSASDSQSVMRFRYGQTREDGDRYRVGHVAAKPAR